MHVALQGCPFFIPDIGDLSLSLFSINLDKRLSVLFFSKSQTFGVVFVFEILSWNKFKLRSMLLFILTYAPPHPNPYPLPLIGTWAHLSEEALDPGEN